MVTKTANPKSLERYFEAVGRRKTAVARVRLEPASKQSLLINDREFETYFQTEGLRSAVLAPLSESKIPTIFKISVKVMGGGISAQATAVRHGIARSLLRVDQTSRKPLKLAGYLKRDPRMKERRKFGLRKARKAKQWSKR